MAEWEVTCTSYAIPVDDDRFLDLLDSESHVTDNAAFGKDAQTLGAKLDAIDGVSAVEYDGHFGANVFLTIDAENDGAKIKQQINETIELHLNWCATLTKAGHAIARRRAS